MILLICTECGQKYPSHRGRCIKCGTRNKTVKLGGFDWDEEVSSTISSTAMRNDQTAFSIKSSLASMLDLDLGNDVILHFALISAGEFFMGSPESEKDRHPDEIQHKVTISKPFYVGIHQVTQKQFISMMNDNPSGFQDGDDFPGVVFPDNLPVESVDWDKSMEFCRRVSRKCGRNVRLPTEAEWEYACRAGTTTPFSFGDALSKYQANKDIEYDRTTPVGSFPENDWGLFDMHGNVWEWCSDWYGDYPKDDVIDPKGASIDPKDVSDYDYRVVRGGSWVNNLEFSRSASRGCAMPIDSGDTIGFRVAMD